MLAPFSALLPNASDIEYWALERAAKILRADPASYQSVEGVEYGLTEPSMFRWDIHFGDRRAVQGIVGLFPPSRLTPHEATTSALADRPAYSVQIRPIMALIDEPLPAVDPIGETIHFHGVHHQLVTPVTAVEFDPGLAVIADGHHRVASALREGGDRLIMTMIVSSTETALDAGAFHRFFPTQVDLPGAIAGCEVFRESPLDAIHAGRMAVVTRVGSIGVSVTDGGVPPALFGVPAGLASRYVLPALGLSEEEARYVDEIREVLGSVDSGGGTAVLLPPSQVGSVMEAAVGRVALPPKSTRFRPKPIRGFLMWPRWH